MSKTILKAVSRTQGNNAAVTEGRFAEPSRVDRAHTAAVEVMRDPLPFGIEANRTMLEGRIDHAVTQKIFPSG